MCEGEFESLKAIYAISPEFVPQPYAWGKYSQDNPETYFLLAGFRDVGEQVGARLHQLIARLFSNRKWNYISILWSFTI